jgi:hypothetical protein
VGRKYQHDDAAIIDGADDLVGVRGAGLDIPWGDLAGETGVLQRVDHLVGAGGILLGIADEYRARVGA